MKKYQFLHGTKLSSIIAEKKSAFISKSVLYIPYLLFHAPVHVHGPCGCFIVVIGIASANLMAAI